jgi:Family of unknown function (DUF6065)
MFTIRGKKPGLARVISAAPLLPGTCRTFSARLPGYNLYVRGASNFPKDGAYALDGIFETDWAVATFTMNCKLTGVGVPVRFGASIDRNRPWRLVLRTLQRGESQTDVLLP